MKEKKTTLTATELQEIVNKLGGDDGALRFLRGDTLFDEKGERIWRERDGAIYLSLESDGTTGREWIKRLEKKGFKIKDEAKDILRSKYFVPSNGEKIDLVILKGALWTGNNRVTKNIISKGLDLNFEKSNMEVLCLMIEALSRYDFRDMNLWWIVAIHELARESSGNPSLLGISYENNAPCLVSAYDSPDRRWDRGVGFVFAVKK